MGMNFAVAPGEYLQEWIDGNGMSVGEFAVELGVTVAEIEDLLTGKEAIGREIACQLERVTSIPSDSWIRFELKYREDLKRMSVGSEESCTSSIHDELASLFRQGGRSWVPVYLLMRDVSENELYKPEYSSFSAWLKDEAARCGEVQVIPKAIRSVCRPDCHHRIGRLCFMACSCSYEYQIAQRRFRGR